MGKRGKLPSNKLPTSKSEPVKPDKDYEARERRYRAEDALRALNRANEIQADKTLMNDVKSLANEQMQSLKKFIK